MTRKKSRRKTASGRRVSPFASLQKRLEAGGMTVIFVKPIPYNASESEKRAYAKRVERAVHKHSGRK